MTARARHGVFVAATDTGVGKTELACLLLRALEAQDAIVCARKPVESGCHEVGGELVAADARALVVASQRDLREDEVCRYRLAPVASPARAAELTHQRMDVGMLVAACQCSNDEFLLVEGAGGLFSPLAADGLNIDLALALRLPTVLVAADRLGCLAQILSNLEAAAARNCSIVAVVLNDVAAGTGDASESNRDLDNAAELATRTQVPIYRLAHDVGGARNRPIAEALATQLLKNR